VSFTAYNLEDKRNAAIVKKYKTYGLSLYFNTIIDGQEFIEGIADIWLAVGNDEGFVDLARQRISETLAGAN